MEGERKGIEGRRRGERERERERERTVFTEGIEHIGHESGERNTGNRKQ